MANILKNIVTKLAQDNNLKITPSSRVVPANKQIRFPYSGDIHAFFKQINVSVKPSNIKVSGSFDTYILYNSKGEEIYYVNNITGSSSKKLFRNKELTPDSFGLGGKRITVDKCIETVKFYLRKKYDANIMIDFFELIDKTNDAKGTDIKLNKNLNYSTSDLSTISKDFGEILASIWYANTNKMQKIYFPPVSNEALVDFYVEKNKIDYPVSVKSGGGGKVTIQNIMNGVLASGVKSDIIEKEYSFHLFKLIDSNNAKEGILEVAKYINAKGIDVLAKIIGVNVNQLSMKTLNEFVKKYSNKELKEKLNPYLLKLNTKISDSVWDKPDKIRFIISPMGEYLWKDLNADTKMTKSLTNLANMISVTQINCDVSKDKIKFKVNSFKNAEFEFGWAGYVAGNKLGFKMKLKG